MKKKKTGKWIRKAGLVAGLAATFAGISMCAPSVVTFAEENVTAAEADKLKEIEELKAKKEAAQETYDAALRDKLLAEDELENARRAVSDAEAEYEDVWARYSTGFAGFLRWVIETEEDPVKVEDAKQVLAATFAEDTQVSADDSANITRMLYMADWLEDIAKYFRLNYRIEAGTSHAVMRVSQSLLNDYDNHSFEEIYNKAETENERLVTTKNAGTFKGVWEIDINKQATNQEGIPVIDDWEARADGLEYYTGIRRKMNGFQYGDIFIEVYNDGEEIISFYTPSEEIEQLSEDVDSYYADEYSENVDGNVEYREVYDDGEEDFLSYTPPDDSGLFTLELEPYYAEKYSGLIDEFIEYIEKYPQPVSDENVDEFIEYIEKFLQPVSDENPEILYDFDETGVQLEDSFEDEIYPGSAEMLGESEDPMVRVETDGNIYMVRDMDSFSSIICMDLQGKEPIEEGVYRLSELNLEYWNKIQVSYYDFENYLTSLMQISRDVLESKDIYQSSLESSTGEVNYSHLIPELLNYFAPSRGITIGEAMGVSLNRGDNVVMGTVFNGEGTYTIDEYVRALREYCAMTDPLAARSVLAQRNDDFDNASRQLAGAEETLLAAGGRLKGAEKEYEEAVAGLAGLVAAEKAEGETPVTSVNEAYAAEIISVEEGAESVNVRYSAESPAIELVTSSSVNISAESPVTESVTAFSEQSPAWSGNTVFDASINETYSPSAENIPLVNDSATAQQALPGQISLNPEAAVNESFTQLEIKPVKAADEIKTEEGLLQTETDTTVAAEPEEKKPHILAEVLSYIFNGGAIAIIIPTGLWRKKRTGDILHGEV